MNANRQEFRRYLDFSFSGEYAENVPLSLHTWYQIGGPADFLAYPRHTEDLISLLYQCKKLDIEFYLMGEGANLLVHDAGYRGVVIKLNKHFREICHTGNTLIASSGVQLNTLVLYAECHHLGGLEYLAGIPGTIGGALTMNAGTYAGEIGDAVTEVQVLDEHLEPSCISKQQIHFHYRSVPELQDTPLLSCTFTLRPEDESVLKTRRCTYLRQRALKQPVEYPSCGSVFKRPPNYYVGKMVQDLGLKGLRYGDAMISDKHGGFIVNLGNAKASHVTYLIQTIQAEVHKHFNIELEPEVRFLGFEMRKKR